MSADFGITFGAPFAPFGLILVSFWLKLGPFWCHVGPDFGLFCTLGCPFWLVLGEINFLRQYFAKKYTCIDLASNFLQIFRMQILFPRPGGGTIAAGNRDRPFWHQVAPKNQRTKTIAKKGDPSLRKGPHFGATWAILGALWPMLGAIWAPAERQGAPKIDLLGTKWHQKLKK